MISSTAFVRFSELDEKAINIEHHVHTIRTDGHGTVEELLQMARQRGIRSIAFTEHVRRDTGWFVEFADEVREAAARFPELSVLVGCEAKALDPYGGLDVSEEILAEADIILGSVHRIPDDTGGFRVLGSMDQTELAEQEYQFAVGLLRGAPIHVLAHPGGMSQRFHGSFPTEHFRSLLEISRERDIAVEISSSYLRDPEGFLELCMKMDPRVSIGSDVHQVESVGHCRDLLRRHFMESDGRLP
jgi:putative hydrolase